MFKALARAGLGASIAAAAACVVGLLGRWSDWADVANHLIPLWLALALAGLAAAAIGRRHVAWSIGAFGIVLALAAWRVAPDWLEPAPAPPGGSPIMLVSVNTWSGNPRQAQALSDLLASRADVITVQEPHGLKSVERAMRQAYPYYAGCTPISDCGAVIFSRHPIRRFIAAPRVGGLHGSSEFGYVWAEIAAPGGSIRVASTHLDWPAPPGRQRAQRAALLAALKRLGGVEILTGDFNLTPTSFALARQDRAFAPLSRRTHALATYPAPWPVLGLDHVYAGPGWRSTRAESFTVAGSDHRAVRIVLARP